MKFKIRIPHKYQNSSILPIAVFTGLFVKLTNDEDLDVAHEPDATGAFILMEEDVIDFSK